MIVPRPKVIEYAENRLYLKQEMKVLVSDDYGKKALQVLNLLTTEIDVVFSSGFNYSVEFVHSSEEFKMNEAYRMECSQEKAVLIYGDERGARNAVVSLVGLIERDDIGFFIPACHVSDYPDGYYRGILIDLAREYIPLKKIKSIIVQMAKAKYNKLHLHLHDSEHYSIQSDVYPELNQTTIQQYTKCQLKEVVEYAQLFSLDIIPEIEMPAHGLFITEKLNELKCQTHNDPPSNWAMCVGNETTYDILANLIKEVSDIFPGECIHIGADELEFCDVHQEDRLWPTWDDCEACQELSRREGLDGKREQFYYFIRRIYETVTGLGKKMMMWNDGIDISSSPNIPRDILIQFWRVAAEGRGPVQGCSMQRFLEEGFHVVNSDYPETYLDLYMKEENIRTWHPKARPETSDEMKHGVIGGEMCAWGPNEHYAYTLPSAIYMFGDKLWGYTDLNPTMEYSRAITKAVLGLNTPSEFDVFEAFGCILLPRTKDGLEQAYTNPNSEKLEHTLIVLQSLIDQQASGRDVAMEYISIIRSLMSNKCGGIGNERVH
ncbi:family 20 glycosylhydrolase [Paenibacillus agaridevorans]|uniref:family 20 glycosylhydrolase n=1 Tax=Paenibacillus agaridevorans TaxID=171404 RepID=UPI001BE4416D|nr:family 20 glycosylhydrolase [Paenibacillus agaridevorans]